MVKEGPNYFLITIKEKIVESFKRMNGKVFSSKMICGNGDDDKRIAIHW